MKMIENDINNNELKQTYLLYGEERYLIRQYKDKLKKAIMGDGDSMNLSEFEGKDIEQKEIIDIAETMPFVCALKIGGSYINESIAELLQNYVQFFLCSILLL